MNKRGLSNVVATVLIILLALAAVIIIWTFIRPALQQAGKGISADCIKLDLVPTSCEEKTPTAFDVTYQWKAGDVGLEKVALVFYYPDGTSVRKDASKPSGVLTSQTASVTDVPLKGLDPASEVRVAGVIGTGDDAQTCTESQAIVC